MAEWLIVVGLPLALMVLMGLLVSVHQRQNPLRLFWPDLSRVKPPDDRSRRLLGPQVLAATVLYLPLGSLAFGLGGWLLAKGEPFGLSLIIILGSTPLFGLVTTIRVLLLVRRFDRLPRQ